MEGVFHVHSAYSSDGKLTLEELREECLARKNEFMVVTDHAEDFDSKKLADYLAHCRRLTDRDFIIVPGLEFNIDEENETHLLLIGSAAFFPGEGPGEILGKVKAGESGALLVLAHPSRNGQYIPPSFEALIHGMEVWNAAYDSRYLPDYRSMLFFERLKKKNKGFTAFGGLDLHDISGFRDLKVCLDRSCADERELMEELKAGRFYTRGPYAGVSSTPDWGFAKMSCLNAGRRILAVADFIKWWIAHLRKQKRSISN